MITEVDQQKIDEVIRLIQRLRDTDDNLDELNAYIKSIAYLLAAIELWGTNK